MKRCITYSCILLTTIILSGGCSTWRVSFMQDPQADFGNYKTFAFTPYLEGEKVPVEFNQIVQREVRNAIQREMETRGYMPAEKPDLVVSVYGRVAEKQRVVGSSGYMGNPYYYGHYSGYDRTWVQTVDYKVGTLVIDLTDARQNRLVWQGIANGTLQERQATGDKLKARTEKIVRDVFAQYPHTAGAPSTKNP